ncbi:MAG: hypothetical protein ABI840_12610, partial [bacterium]
MKKVSIIIFLFAYLSSFAQPSFEKVFHMPSAIQLEVCFKSIELKSEEIISCGTNDGCTSCPTTNYIMKFDSAGNTLWQKFFNPGNVPIPIDITVSAENNIVFITGNEDIDSSGFRLISINI